MTLDLGGKILVVDDEPINIRVVSAILREAGYQVIAAKSGQQALQLVASQAPELILLDVTMPDMDGFAVLEALQQPATQQLPVIFLTALNDPGSLATALSSGAVDYVTKPFQAAELLARTRTHLALKRSRDALAESNARLQTLNTEKSEILGLAAHDLRNPLANILAATELLLQHDALSRPKTVEVLTRIARSSRHMAALIQALLNVYAIEEGQFDIVAEPMDAAELVQSWVDAHREVAAAKRIELEFTAPAAVLSLDTDRVLCGDIITNLLSNAIKYSPPGSRVQITLQAYRPDGVATGDAAWVRLAVSDQGPGLTAEDQQRLFGKFTRLSAKPTAGESSTGLGLSIVRKLVQALGGEIWCESAAGQGATFYVALPAKASVLGSSDKKAGGT